MIVFSYKYKSKSAGALAKALGVKFMLHEHSQYKGDFIINWGGSTGPNLKVGQTILNHPLAVARAIDKYRAFCFLREAKVSHVPFTSVKAEAQQWLDDGSMVFARTTNGHGGKGITVVNPGEIIPDAPLYTKYIKKSKEYRVHVFDDEILDVTEKRKKAGVDANPLIRNHANGWVFCRQNIEEPEGLQQLALAAIAAVDLDFGAVDIIYNKHYNQLYVLEVNTAPGLEGTTLEKYKNAIQNCGY